MKLTKPQLYLHVFIEKTRKGKQRYIDTYLRSTRFVLFTQFFFLSLCLMWLCLRDWDSCRVDHWLSVTSNMREYMRETCTNVRVPILRASHIGMRAAII